MYTEFGKQLNLSFNLKNNCKHLIVKGENDVYFFFQCVLLESSDARMRCNNAQICN